MSKINLNTFVDLFAGIGGFRIALDALGLKCRYSSEWNKFAKITYYENFGEVPDDDITKVDEKVIPGHDVLCAGFPCQAFSISALNCFSQALNALIIFSLVNQGLRTEAL